MSVAALNVVTATLMRSAFVTCDHSVRSIGRRAHAGGTKSG